MVPTDRLFHIAAERGIIVDFFRFSGPVRGSYSEYPWMVAPVIVLDSRMRDGSAEFRSVFAEEIGHARTSTGICATVFHYSDRIVLSKMEKKAWAFAGDLMMPTEDVLPLVEVYSASEIAECFGVTERLARFQLGRLAQGVKAAR